MKTNIVCLLLAILPATYLRLPAQGIKISSGASLVMNGSANLVLSNSGLTNNGQFSPGIGTVVFSGNSATSGSFINGSSSTGFYNLTLNKSANGIQLGRNITLSNTFCIFWCSNVNFSIQIHFS